MEIRTRSPSTSVTGPRSAVKRREVEYGGLTWLDLIEPTAADIAYLRERFSLDSLALENVLSTVQRPKLDLHAQDQYLFMILHIPSFDRENRVLLNEVDFFVGRDFVVSVHDGGFKSLRRLFAAVASDEPARAQLLGRGSGYLLYRIIDTLIKPCFPLLYRLEDELDRLDTRLFKPDTRTIVQDLATLRRDITTVYHILRPNLAVGEALRNIDAPFLKLDAARFFGHTTDSLARLQDMAEELQQVMAGLTTTLDSITAQHTNKVLRVIVFTLFFLIPLALISAFAGLNIVLPFTARPPIFGAVMGAVVVITALVIVLVRSRRWP